VHLAEPVETRALRGRKRRAKTDREDARWLRELLAEGRLPEAWIPPELTLCELGDVRRLSASRKSWPRVATERIAPPERRKRLTEGDGRVASAEMSASP
jgi:hypothetical protein